MSKKAKARPALFILPRDRDMIRAFGYSHAIECAYVTIRDQVQLLPVGESALAVNACLLFEKRVYQGKAGANDPLLYRHTYIDAFNAAYPIARELLLTGQLVVDSSWAEPERHAIFYTYACKALGLLEVRNV